MKNLMITLIILSMTMPVLASNQELDLQAVFLGKFAKFIQWPQQNKAKFIITLIDENPFDNLLDALYKDKTIHSKPIEIRYVTQIEDIKDTDILFITLDKPTEIQEAIQYAQQNAILTISSKRGFAQRGGIIQINFVMQKTRLVINYLSSIKSNLKISAPLLAIAHDVIREDK